MGYLQIPGIYLPLYKKTLVMIYPPDFLEKPSQLFIGYFGPIQLHQLVTWPIHTGSHWLLWQSQPVTKSTAMAYTNSRNGCQRYASPILIRLIGVRQHIPADAMELAQYLTEL